MGKVSKELLKQAGIHPKLRLGIKQEKGGVQSTGAHRVKLIGEKIVKGIDRETGQAIDFVKYVFEEDGELKEYRTRLKHKETGELQYLVQNMANVDEGQEVILEMKKMGAKNYIEVRNIDGSKITD